MTLKFVRDTEVLMGIRNIEVLLWVDYTRKETETDVASILLNPKPRTINVVNDGTKERRGRVGRTDSDWKLGMKPISEQ